MIARTLPAAKDGLSGSVEPTISSLRARERTRHPYPPAQLELPVGACKLVGASVSESTGQACSSVPHRFMPPTSSRAVPGPLPTSGLFEEGLPLSVKEVY